MRYKIYSYKFLPPIINEQFYNQLNTQAKNKSTFKEITPASESYSDPKLLILNIIIQLIIILYWIKFSHTDNGILVFIIFGTQVYLFWFFYYLTSWLFDFYRVKRKFYKKVFNALKTTDNYDEFITLMKK